MSIRDFLLGAIFGGVGTTLLLLLARSQRSGSQQDLRELEQKDTGDPLSDAERRMAYGLYDEAAAVVQQALSQEPDRVDLKVKLLEVYFIWGNKTEFLAAAKRFHGALHAEPHWTKVTTMGRGLCPDDSLFSGNG